MDDSPGGLWNNYSIWLLFKRNRNQKIGYYIRA